MSSSRLIPVVVAVAALACDRGSMSPSANTVLLEPTGLKQLNEQSWNALSDKNWSYLRRTSAKDADIVSDPDAPSSPDRVLRIIFTPDMPRDTEPSVHWISLPEPREVHARWWIKLSSNWTGSPAGACKMTFLWPSPGGHGQVYSALIRSSEPHSVIVNTEWAPYGQKIWESNWNATPIYYGRWYRIDWHVRWSTAPGAADGLLRWWVDGVLNGNHFDVVFPAGATAFHQFEFAPTIQIPPPAEQYMYIDHVSVRGR
ncbi:MAG TPA: hypothetical protein VFT47_07070 [Vicinamibacterales bacterium]|nr:hypothetical protein [Vicinamibacterales bacterium]